ncbi:hypothetical protein L6164_034219 [Bauhinia variegata]|uniref:Uncharacterized protein n=1 Tax=Bauhinia variegata TaxID=167791 RepID=A0ACB9KU57_BAUVA|nr:hypothetical protein L6164_034219 [Bauhinia variegata]
MAARVLATLAISKLKPLKTLSSNSLLLAPFLFKSLLSWSRWNLDIDSHCSSLDFVVCKVCGQEPIFGHHCNIHGFPLMGRQCIHSGPFLKFNDKVVEPLQDSEKSSTVNSSGNAIKRKKLKGKRAVVRWLKFFGWKKKRVSKNDSRREDFTQIEEGDFYCPLPIYYT